MKGDMDIITFGHKLIESGDLDPLYIALWGAKMPKPQLARWLVAYWCFYHAGLSGILSERRDFFDALMEVAEGGTAYPRGTERRHFRGELAITSIEKMGEQFNNASEIIGWLVKGGPTATGIMKRVKQLHGFGEWISWKVPDMIERLDMGKVVFKPADVKLMFKTSLQGAKLTYSTCGLKGSDELLEAHEYLIAKLGVLKSPPRYERRINVQETETVFCKWKSHLGGHYPLGKDTEEIRLGLVRYGRCRTTQKMIKVLRAHEIEYQNREGGV